MRVVFCCLLLILCIGCEANVLHEQRITVTLQDSHPWGEASHRPLWHTLVYTDGEGTRSSIHLIEGQRSITLTVPRDSLTVFCAYPLSFLHPYGGFYHPGADDTVTLTQEQGELAKLLLDSYQFNPEAVEHINATYLADEVGDATLLDGNALVVSLLNGEGIPSNLSHYEKLEVVVSDIPSGYWVPERLNQEPFWNRWGEAFSLELEGGLQRFLNREGSLCLSLYVDLEKGEYLSSLSKAPPW
nr:hypothetical protein [uncultured Sphaerochaeta sp.]